MGVQRNLHHQTNTRLKCNLTEIIGTYKNFREFNRFYFVNWVNTVPLYTYIRDA